MADTPPKKRANLDDMRDRALDVARDLLLEGGPEQVKARTMAVRLGVSVGTVYNLFGDLDELLFHVNARAYGQLETAILAADKELADAEPVDRMLGFAKAYLHFVADHEQLWSGVLQFNRRRKTHVPQWYRERERALFSLAETTFKSLPGAASAKQRAVLSRALWASIHGIVTISVGQDGLVASEDDVWEQIETVLRAVAHSLAPQKTD